MQSAQVVQRTADVIDRKAHSAATARETDHCIAPGWYSMPYLHRRFSNGTVPGRALGAPLRLVPATKPMPVLSGPNRGLRWIAGTGPHSCWLGFYEAKEVKTFARLIRPGSTVM